MAEENKNQPAKAKTGTAAATRRPAWGAKKVGEKPSFSPSANGGVTYRFASYFGFMPK